MVLTLVDNYRWLRLIPCRIFLQINNGRTFWSSWWITSNDPELLHLCGSSTNFSSLPETQGANMWSSNNKVIIRGFGLGVLCALFIFCNLFMSVCSRVVKVNHNVIFSPQLLHRFLTFAPRAVNISTIDLTSCYWVTSSFILNLVSRLKQVENVLVADTPLLSKHLKQLLKILPNVSHVTCVHFLWMYHMNFCKLMRDILFRLREFLGHGVMTW